MEVRRVLPYDENDQPVITYQPPASATVAGVVKIGSNLTMSDDGVLSANSQGITVDSALSLTSENPVQNKVITSALGSKADTSAIPTATSDLTNDSGFITTSALTNYALKSELPEDVSELNNDAGYITSSAVGNATITITQDGTTKGSFTVNQMANATINLDGGSTPSWGSIEGTLSDQEDLQAALDEKQDAFSAVNPLVVQPIGGTGVAYIVDTSTVYSDNIINGRVSLLKSGALATGLIENFDFAKSWEVTRSNVVINAMEEVTNIIYIGIGGKGVAQWYVNSSQAMEVFCNFGTSSTTGTVAITLGESYDFRITYDGSSATTFQYKLSSASSWTTARTRSASLSGTATYSYVTLGGNSSIVSKLEYVTFYNNGTLLYQGGSDNKELVINYDSDTLGVNSNNELYAKLSGYATTSALSSGLATKQNILTFDSTPTSGSTNPVTSGGVYTALAAKQDVLTWTYDSETENLTIGTGDYVPVVPDEPL